MGLLKCRFDTIYSPLSLVMCAHTMATSEGIRTSFGWAELKMLLNFDAGSCLPILSRISLHQKDR